MLTENDSYVGFFGGSYQGKNKESKTIRNEPEKSLKNGNKESVQGGHTNLFNILRRNSINNMNRD